MHNLLSQGSSSNFSSVSGCHVGELTSTSITVDKFRRSFGLLMSSDTLTTFLWKNLSCLISSLSRRRPPKNIAKSQSSGVNILSCEPPRQFLARILYFQALVYHLSISVIVSQIVLLALRKEMRVTHNKRGS